MFMSSYLTMSRFARFALPQPGIQRFCHSFLVRFHGGLVPTLWRLAELVLQAAQKRGEHVEIVEWPGGEPKQIDLDVTPDVFASVRKGRMTVPLGKQPDLAVVAGLPWGSMATVHSAGDKLYRIVGPAIWQTDKWSLPVFSTDAEGLPEYENEGARLRRSFGLESASVLIELRGASSTG
jgi:hypothetical protein